MALLLAGLPDTIPGVTVNRLCASGLNAVGAAAQAIRAGEIDFAIAGGVESMTRAPFVMGKAQEAFQRAAEIHDTTIGWRFINPLMKQQYGVDAMPETGENVAEEFQVSAHRPGRLRAGARSSAPARRSRRATSPRRSCRSRCRAARPARPWSTRTSIRGPRRRSKALAKLKPFVRNPGTITAGNASGVNDGAAAMILASEAAAKAHGLTPRARILGMASAGVPPRIMGIGPVPSTRKLMERLGLKIGDFDVIELNEAFAVAGARLPAPARAAGRRRARQSERRRDRARPSARHVGRAARADGRPPARNDGGKRALATMCVGVGQGVSLALERV